MASDNPEIKQRLVVGISGASGVILGIRILEVLRSMAVETHLILFLRSARHDRAGDRLESE